MKKFGFLKITGSSLLAVFLLSFAAACTPKEEPSDVPAVQADSVLVQNVETLAQDGTAESGEQAAAAEEKGGQTEEDTGEEAGEKDSGVSQNSAGENVSGNQVSGDGIPDEDGSGEETEGQDVSGNKIPARELLRPCGDDVSGNSVFGNSVSGNSVSGNSISGNSVSDNSVSGNDTSEKAEAEKDTADEEEEEGEVSGNSVSGNDVSGNDVSGNGVSGNDVSGNGVSDNDISGNTVSGSDIVYRRGKNESRLENPFGKKRYTLAQRQAVRSSHKETLLVNEQDKRTISENNIDFTDIKITCLGDSITQAVNLDSIENYQDLAYPHVLGEALDARQVYNLGIGGSSIGRYWADAFVDRYENIPKDTDIILVMGGTNDEFCASLVEFGNSAERKKRTFWGDLDELMDGLKENYPHAEVIFMTPLPNSLQDYLKTQHPYLISQDKFADVISQLAQEHGMEVIDLYNSNILDGHDKDNVLHFMPDGVHPNADGYQILGEHVAADLIRILQSRQQKTEQ